MLDYFLDIADEYRQRKLISNEDNLVLSYLINKRDDNGNQEYNISQIDAYIDLMQDGINVRPLLNPSLNQQAIYMLGSLLKDGYNINGYADILDRMSWIDAEALLLQRAVQLHTCT